jgi:hypothetical protein
VEILTSGQGEVFVNGRAAGYSPRIVRRLPAGPVRIEVRQNGVVTSSRTVQLGAGRHEVVRLR